MSQQTQSETDDGRIESLDIANDDLIEVLAELAEHHRTNGASTSRSIGQSLRLAVVGEGQHKMLLPENESDEAGSPAYDSQQETIYAGRLLDGDSVADTIEVNGQDATLNVL